ncbi:MAG: vitamin K epoxide reductase family protein [Gemmatimonadales bacterium]
MTRHRQAIALLALVGLFVAAYLWLYQLGVAGELKCGAGGCDTVQASPWARFLGVPVAFYGVVGYAAILGVALAGLRPAALPHRGPAILLAILATGGVLCSAWLTYLELFVIHAICRWCVASAVIITAIWVVALAGLRRADAPQLS